MSTPSSPEKKRLRAESPLGLAEPARVPALALAELDCSLPLPGAGPAAYEAKPFGQVDSIDLSDLTDSQEIPCAQDDSMYYRSLDASPPRAPSVLGLLQGSATRDSAPAAAAPSLPARVADGAPDARPAPAFPKSIRQLRGLVKELREQNKDLFPWMCVSGV